MICICFSLCQANLGACKSACNRAQSPRTGRAVTADLGLLSSRMGPVSCSLTLQNLLHVARPALEIPRGAPRGKHGAVLFRHSDTPCASTRRASPLTREENGLSQSIFLLPPCPSIPVPSSPPFLENMPNLTTSLSLCHAAKLSSVTPYRSCPSLALQQLL